MHAAATGSNVHQIGALFKGLAIVVAITLTAVGASAQLGTQDQTLFRGRTDLVSVGVSVAAKRHRFVTNLSASDFAVYEDGRPQQIFAFASGVQPGPPLHVGVLLDVSGSQGLDLAFTQRAVIKFLTSVPDAVDVTFIDFASHVRSGRYSPGDFPRLVKRVRDLTAGGETSLYDAIGLYLDGASEQDGRKVGGPIGGLSTQPLYFDVRLPADVEISFPTPANHNAFLYVYEGDAVVGDDAKPLTHRAAGLLTPGTGVRVRAGRAGARLLLLAGKPIGEPVVQYGPFVMNTPREIEQAFADYGSGKFGHLDD